jgi:hypothetical protein
MVNYEKVAGAAGAAGDGVDQSTGEQGKEERMRLPIR